MTWAALLLADPSPCLRYLVLRQSLGRPEDDPEVQELAGLRETDPLVERLLELQGDDGLWRTGSPAWVSGDATRLTYLALARLGYLGFGPEHPAVARGAEALFSLQAADGSWPLPGGSEGYADGDQTYTMIPLQTALPLVGLALCGFASHPPAERAYEWLLAQRLSDGAWPTGIASTNYGGVGGYRRLAHSRWGCRSNTTAALRCLALHPERRQGPEARRALDLLLGRETHDRSALGFEVARLIGAEQTRGFLTFHARFDAALVLDLCRRVGATTEDERVAGLVRFVTGEQGPYGLWGYPARPQASRWVTFDLLRSLSELTSTGEWVSLEPRTPFQAYPRKERRY